MSFRTYLSGSERSRASASEFSGILKEGTVESCRSEFRFFSHSLVEETTELWSSVIVFILLDRVLFVEFVQDGIQQSLLASMRISDFSSSILVEDVFGSFR